MQRIGTKFHIETRMVYSLGDDTEVMTSLSHIIYIRIFIKNRWCTLNWIVSNQTLWQGFPFLWNQWAKRFTISFSNHFAIWIICWKKNGSNSSLNGIIFANQFVWRARNPNEKKALTESAHSSIFNGSQSQCNKSLA